MKLNIFYFAILFSIISLSCADSKVSKPYENDSDNINNKFAVGIENDLKLMNLLGHPKSIKEFKYNPTIENGEIVPITKNKKK